jgi:hypothetical protein
MSTPAEDKSKSNDDDTQVTTASNPDTVNTKNVDVAPKSILDLKRSRYNELLDWLKKWGFNVVDRSKDNKILGIEFQAEIQPQVPYSSGLSTPFYLEFQDDLEDGFIIRTTFELDKNIEIYLDSQNRAREIELTYIEIGQSVLPLRISIIREHPFIKLYKIIFITNLDKQFFYDSITDLMNSMSIIIGKWDERYYQIKPTQTKINKENKTKDLELEKILKK